jgi:hypothetical protein
VRLFSKTLQELTARGLRKATAAGDGFADGLSDRGPAATLRARLGRPMLSQADWVEIRPVPRI